MNYCNDNTPPKLAKRLTGWFLKIALMLVIAAFLDWLVLNIMLGCCEGGVCWPDIYPDCRNATYNSFYGEGYDQAAVK